MVLRKNSEIDTIQGSEGTKIKQYFHPHNTSNGINYSLAHFTLEPGKKSKLHKIKSSEIYYILEGHGEIIIDNERYQLEKDDSIYIPANSSQYMKNLGSVNLKFLCIVEPAWKTDDEIILE
jgi:mannose-6-phosphate isomerase-like protein (cupin superfamily)